ncbi:MAG: hypothetical protein WC437_02075 [Patescibacteria group bacterium]
MSKSLFIALITALVVAFVVAIGLSVALVESHQKYDKFSQFAANTVYGEGGYYQQVYDLEGKVENLEWVKETLIQRLADNKASHKATVKELKQEIASLKGPARRGRTSDMADLRAQFQNVKSSTSWPIWDREFDVFLDWYTVEGRPASWGNLGDAAFPILVEKAKAHEPGAYERYQLLNQYVRLARPILGFYDEASFGSLKTIKEIIY